MTIENYIFAKYKNGRQRPAPAACLSLFVFRFSFLIDVDRRSLGEGDAVGSVEGVEVHLAHADVEHDGGHGAQEFAPILGVKTPISSEKYLLPILGTLIQKSTDLMPLIPENISDTLVQCFKLNLMVSTGQKRDSVTV